MKTLVLGGARSGKSTWAEKVAHEYQAAGGRVSYLATSRNDPADAEWQERIALHRARRPSSWATIETTDIASELARDDNALLLVDCLAVWITRMMDSCGIWAEPATSSTPLDGQAARASTASSRQQLADRVNQLVCALATTRRDVVMVSNEVGLSVVPDHWSGRFFRDQLGLLNMRVAEHCDRVALCVAGIPMMVKDVR